MGLLRKANPKATCRSVCRHAVNVSLIGNSLYASILWWNGSWMDWPLKLGTSTVLLLLVGGLWEWQVPWDTLDEDNDSQCHTADSKQSQR